MKHAYLCLAVVAGLVTTGAWAQAGKFKVTPNMLTVLKAPPSPRLSPGLKFNPNLPILVKPMVDVTITLNGVGRIKGPNFQCITPVGKTSTICTRKMEENVPVLLDAIGKDGNILTAWAGACSGKATTCAIIPKGKVQVAATFGPPPVQQMVTIKVNIPDGAGSVKAGSLTPNGMACDKSGGGAVSGTCTVKVPLGSPVSLIAAPAGQSAFNGWESDQPGCAGFECAFTAQDPVVLTARFGAKTATSKLTVLFVRGVISGLWLKPTPALNFTCSPAAMPPNSQTWVSTCTADVPTGSLVQLAGDWVGGIGAGYDIPLKPQDWNGECQTKTGGVCSVIMTQDRTVLASWAQ